MAASDPDDEWDWEKDTLGAEGIDTLIAEHNGIPIGVVQITDLARDQSRYWGPSQSGVLAIDLWIGPSEMRGIGIGRTMMESAIDYCFSNAEVHTILIDPLASNTEAIRFYQRCGFQFIGNGIFGNHECAVHQLLRLLNCGVNLFEPGTPWQRGNHQSINVLLSASLPRK